MSMPDAAINRTDRFTALLCTGGIAGDPTCPYNIVDLSSADSRLRTWKFTLQPAGQDVSLADDSLDADRTLRVNGLFIEVWGSAADPALFTLATTLTVPATSIPAVTLTGFEATSQMSLRIGGVANVTTTTVDAAY